MIPYMKTYLRFGYLAFYEIIKLNTFNTENTGS
jgi:hypothetical protein